MKMKRYPKENEGRLAYRIAKSWVQDCVDIIAQRRDPAKLSALMDRGWVGTFIYEWEDEQAGAELQITKAALVRIRRQAIREAGAILTGSEIYSHIVAHFRDRKVRDDAQALADKKAARDARRKEASRLANERNIERGRNLSTPVRRHKIWDKLEGIQAP